MIAETKFPISMAERLELGAGELRWPATFDEFVELLDEADYSIEFQHEEIIVMSIASDQHEKIVANLLMVLGIAFRGNKNLHRYGSNRHVFATAEVKGGPVAYSPDASVVKGQPDIFEYSRGKTANTNPWLVVEVISKSSRHRDFGDKLPIYRAMPSVEFILFVEQDLPLATLWTRRSPTRWTSEDFDALDQHFEVGGCSISMADIFDNVIF